MAKLIFMIGLPGSGKSTLSKRMVAESVLGDKVTKLARVNKDDLRTMYHNGHFSKSNEDLIKQAEIKLIAELIMEGRDVVIDNTGNMLAKNRTNMAEAVRSLVDIDLDIELNTDCVGVTPQTCIERDAQRDNPVGSKVIMKWWRTLVREGFDPRPIYEAPVGLPKIVLCDLDGTLAHANGRDFFDWDKVDTDFVDDATRIIIESLMSGGKVDQVIFFSGRSSVCFDITLEWINKHLNPDLFVHGETFELFMRTAGDMRKDTIVKREMFYNYIDGVYDPLFVIDDRVGVCEMWRWDVGVQTFQAGYPEIPF